MKHAFTRDILLINDAIAFGLDLIKEAEKIGGFQDAQVANNEKGGYISDIRTNSRFFLDGKKYPELKLYVDQLDTSLDEAKKIYASYNKYLYANLNFGYDLLKYETLQYFDEHVDLIPGHDCFKNRQLSTLFYLNDDYVGGETYFPRQEVQLKPPKGSIALFPPFYTHPHTSLPVQQGVKYVVAAWLYS